MKLRTLAIVAIIATLGGVITACTNATVEGVSEEQYNALREKHNKNVEDYNALVERNNARAREKNELIGNLKESLDEHINTSRSVALLDAAAIDVRKQTRKIREGLDNYTNAFQIKLDMKKLDKTVQTALTIVGNMADQTTKKNVKVVVDNADKVIQADQVEYYKELAKHAGNLANNLSGLRDLFLGQYNDLLDLVNVKARTLPGGTNINIDPSREADRATEDVNPVVESFDDGGRVTGIARDSVSGRAIDNAFVGFKRKAESTDYFFETRTNAQGQYQSPYLLPGTYFVDIRRDGYINVQNQQVRVQRGQEARENLSLSEPLEDGVYRITMSWTSQKRNAVRDVDSYLQIPGIADPLYYRLQGQRYHGAHLDRDDTDWIGPETVTIHDLKSGTYVYYVRNYSDRGNSKALGNSEVRVKLYKGSQLIKNLMVPQGRGRSYELFRIENGNIRYTGEFGNR